MKQDVAGRDVEKSRVGVADAYEASPIWRRNRRRVFDVVVLVDNSGIRNNIGHRIISAGVRYSGPLSRRMRLGMQECSAMWIKCRYNQRVLHRYY